MKKKILKSLFVSAVVGATSTLMLIPSFAGTWKQEGKSWKYYNEDGKLATGWVKDNGKWYYLDSTNGELKTGWFKDSTGKWYLLNPISNGDKGAMLTGWQWVDGNCYYLNPNGDMLASGETPDGYKVNADGKWIDASGNAIYVSDKGISTKVSTPTSSVAKGVSFRSSSSGGGGGSSASASSVKIEEKKTELPKVEEKKEETKPEEKKQEPKAEEKTENPKIEDKKVELKIKSVAKLADIEVANGISKEDYEKLLPKKVSLTLSDESVKEVEVTKVDTSKVDTKKAGEYELNIEYALPEGVVGEKPSISVKLIVAKALEVKLESIENLKDINIDYQMAKEDYEKLLPKTIKLKLSDKTEKEVSVRADASTIDTSKEAEYIVKLAYELPEGVSGDKLEASVKVIVTKPSIVGYTKVEPVTMEKDDGNPYWGKFPTEIELILSNGQKRKVRVKKTVIDGYNYQEGKYVVHLQYDMPADLKGEAKDVVSELTVTPKSTMTFEKAEYSENENPILKVNYRDLLDSDIISIEALKSEYDYYPKTLEKDVDYKVDTEADTITFISSEVLKKSYGSSAYASGKLNGNVKLYFDITLRKSENSARKLYSSIEIQYKKASEESVKPKEEDDSNLILASVGGSIGSSQNREDTSYPVYYNNWESLDESKLSQIRFYKDGTNDLVEGLILVSEAFNDDDKENGTKSTVLKVPFDVVKDKLVDNKISLYGKGGGYKIKKFTITYEAN